MAVYFNKNRIIDFRTKKSISVKLRALQKLICFAGTTFICNISYIFWNLIKIFNQASLFSKPKRVIILGFGGIGNHVMLTPAIKNLKKTFPEINLHLVVTSSACAEILENNIDIDSLSIANIGLMNRLSKYFAVGLNLRDLKPDVVISAAGTDPVAGSIISFISGARNRIGEDWRGRGFLFTLRVKANSKISEIEQNIRLFSLIGAKRITFSPILYLTEDEICEARRWLKELEFPTGAKIIGIHPGSGKGQTWKRWDIENFVAVTRKITLLSKVRVIIFLGPDETELYDILNSAKLRFTKILKGNDSIRETAAKISLCHSFLSNDSGLRHIAMALNVNSIGIFGPTSIKKNHYGGGNHKTISTSNVLCCPCHFTSWWLACGNTKPCLKSIDPEDVAQELMGTFNRN